MGGSQEVAQANIQYETVTNDLDKIEFIISFRKYNTSLIDQYKLQDSISKDIKSYLGKIGIKGNELEVGGLGGGGSETLLDILHLLWENKNIVTFLYSTFSLVKRYVNNWYFSKLKNYSRSSKPGVSLTFQIATYSDVDLIKNDELNYILNSRVINLLVIGNSICDFIKEKYDFLQSVNLSVEAFIRQKQYNINYNIQHDLRGERSINRFIKIIDSSRVCLNLHLTYNFKNKLIITRDDLLFIENNDAVEFKRSPTYYLIVSTKLLKDK